MSIPRYVASALFLLAGCVSAVPAQQPLNPSQPNPNRIYLDVVVTPKSGVPVPGLQKSDFTVLDNKATRPIVTFDEFSGPKAPIEIVLLVDAVNTTYTNLSYERQQIDSFLRANGGHLAHPTSLAVFTDTGTQIQQDFSSDGYELSAAFDKADIGLREIRRGAGFYGAEDRLSLSLNALQMLTAKEAARPGRKIILWISPGWPYLSGPNVDIDSKQERQLFAEIVALSTQLRTAGITLYSIDPLGSNENVSWELYYQSFLKGVAKPNQAQPGDLGLQVLAVQSGGLALSASNDIAGRIAHCIADLGAYYRLSFDAPPAERPDEYHQLDVKVAPPGLTTRTRTGYYSQP
jgi:VWFA-related protein